MSTEQATDTYPSLVWVIVPILLVPLGLFIRSQIAARKLARTGIGRGAPGFQTSVRRIAVTPEIAARLRAGEQVSPEEIAAAQATAATSRAAPVGTEDKKELESLSATNQENEWLPEDLRRENKGETKSRKGKKRR